MPDSRSLLEALFAAGDAGDLDSFDQYLHQDVIVHAPAGFSTVGLQNEKLSWRKAKLAIPNLHHEFADVLTTSSNEAARTVVTGTMDGSYGGFTASGRLFKIDQALFARVCDGKISEIWEIIDVASLREQLGKG